MIGLDYARNIRSIQLREFLLLVWCRYESSTPSPLGFSDVPDSLDCHHVNCCDSNSSQSGKLCHRVRSVRHDTIPFSERSLWLMS